MKIKSRTFTLEQFRQWGASGGRASAGNHTLAPERARWMAARRVAKLRAKKNEERKL